MSALKSGLRRPGLTVYLALLILAAQNTHSAPIENDSTQVAEYDGAGGCYYNFQHYQEGARIITNEPCLNCTCHNRMLMCYLRVCPFSKAIGQDCTVEKRPDQCCPVITCPEVPVQLLTSTTTSPALKSPTSGSTELGFPDTYGCSINDRFFADGAQLPINSSNPCELCYCIRNKTTCLMQQCTLSVAGCKPVYQPGICCPVKYNCDYDENNETTPGLLMTTTTTVAPRISPQCTHDDKIYDDGELIYTIQPCQHCYCFHGEIVCAVQECGKPMESHSKNCTALPPLDGECCPSYQCEDGLANVATEMPEVTDRNEVPQESVSESFPGANNDIPEEIAENHSSTTEEPQTVSSITNEVPESRPSESPATADEYTTEEKPIESKEPSVEKITEKAPTPDETVIQNTTPMPTKGDEMEASDLPPRIGEDVPQEGESTSTTESNNIAEASTESKSPQIHVESTTSVVDGEGEVSSNEPEVISTERDLEPEQQTTIPLEGDENISPGEIDITTAEATTVREGVDKTSESSSPVSEVITTEQIISKESTEPTPLSPDVKSNKPVEPVSETTEQSTAEPSSNKEPSTDSTVEVVTPEVDYSTTLSPNIDSSSSTSATDNEPENVEPVITPETTIAEEPSKEDVTEELDSGSSTPSSVSIEKEPESAVSDETTTDGMSHDNDNSLITTTETPTAETTKLNDETVSEETKEPISPELSTPESIENIIPEDTDTKILPDGSSKSPESVTAQPESTTSNAIDDNEGAETRIPFETSTLPNLGGKKSEDETPSSMKPIANENDKTEESPLENITVQTPEESTSEVSEEPIIPEKGPSGIPSVPKPERGPVNKKVDSNETLPEPEVTEGSLVTGSGMPHNIDNLQTEEPEYGSTSYLPPLGSSTEADHQSSTPVYEEPPKDDDTETQTTELSITPKITYDTTPSKPQLEESSSEMTKPDFEDNTTSEGPNDESSTLKDTDVSPSTEGATSETPDTPISEKEKEVEQPPDANLPNEDSTTIRTEESEPSVSDKESDRPEDSEGGIGVSKSPETDEITNAPGINQLTEKTVSEGTTSEPVTITRVSSEAPEFVTKSQETSSEGDILSPSTESQQKSEGTESSTEIPSVVEPNVSVSTDTEKSSEKPLELTEPNLDATTLPSEDKLTTSKHDKPTEAPIEVETPESPAAPVYTETSTENSKESSVETDDQSKQIPETVSASTVTTEKLPELSTQESVSEAAPEKSQTSGEVPEKVEESSHSTESNEITSPTPIVELEVSRPVSGIPGEGNCLVDGQSYTNNSAVPPSNPCQLNCRCVSSMVNCELVKCLSPPDDLPPNCTPMYAADSCCPMYICDTTPKVELKTGNQMSDSHTTVSYDESKTQTPEKLPEELSTENPKLEEPAEPTVKSQTDKESTTVSIAQAETVGLPVSTESPTTVSLIDDRNKEDTDKESVSPSKPSETGAEMTEATTVPIDITSEKSSGEDETVSVQTEKPTQEKSDSEPESHTEKGDSKVVTERIGVEGSSEPNAPVEQGQDSSSSTQLPGMTEAPGSEPAVTVMTVESDNKEITPEPSKEPPAHSEIEVTSPSTADSTTLSEKTNVEDETQKPEDMDLVKQTSESTESSPITSTESLVKISTESSSAIPEKEPTEDSSIKPSQDASQSTILPEADITTILPELSSSPVSVITDEEVNKPPQESTTENVISEASEDPSKIVVESTPSTSTERKPSDELLHTTVNPETESPMESSSTVSPIDEATKSEIPETSSSIGPQPEEITEPGTPTEKPIEETNVESTEISKKPSFEEPITTLAPSHQLDVKIASSDSPTETETETESSTKETSETNIETKLETSTEPPGLFEDNKDETTTSDSKSKEHSTSTPIIEHTNAEDEGQERPIETPIETSSESEQVASSPAPRDDEVTTKGDSQFASEEPLSTTELTKTEEEKTPETSSTEESNTEKSVSGPALETSSAEPTSSEITTSESTLGQRLGEHESSTPSIISEEPLSHPESTSEISTSTVHEIEEQATKESTPAQEPISTESSESASSEDDQKIHLDTQAYHTEEPITKAPQNVPEQSSEHSEATVPHKRPEYPDQPEDLPQTDDENVFSPDAGNIKDPIDAPDMEGEDYDGTDEHIYGPGTCRYGGKIYMSAQQIPRDDPCDFCFCFRSDIICLQQSCPPPIPGCHEEPISGFCCPRYECPVSMAMSLNVTTTTTTTTTTVPPHFLSHAYRGNASRGGCQIGNRAYRVGEEIKSKSGPCMGCTCGGDGKMKCEPKACSASPMLKEMIAHAAAKRRRR